MVVNADVAVVVDRRTEHGAPPTVSVALIVKNEERTLGRCLDSFRDAVDEIIVVDTGSKDATKAIAHRYTDKVFDFPWVDDFAAARQFAFDHAAGDWVVWVDADDVVLHADRIRPLIASAADDVCGFSWRYVYAKDAAGRPTCEMWRERCVRNNGSFRWAGRVHEVLTLQAECTQLPSDDVVIEHRPPPGRTNRDPRRNLRILEAESAASDGAASPRLLFYLGREYADVGDRARAIEVLEEYLRVGTWNDERYLAQTQVAALLRAEQRYEAAADADLRALKIHPRWPGAYFGLAATYYFLQDWPKVVHWTDLGRGLPTPETTLFLNPLDHTHNWIIYYTNALYHTGRAAEALAWTRRALERVPDDPWHLKNLRFIASATRSTTSDGAPVLAFDPPTYAVIPVRDRHHLTDMLLAQLGLPPERVIVVDNGSAVPAREALGGRARVVEHPIRNISELWNVGLDLVATECRGPHNVAVLNNDLDVAPGFLARLATALRVRPDRLIAYPDFERRLPPGVCDAGGRMCGYAFMLRGEVALRADPRFVWWYGDDDLERQGRARGKVVCVGGATVRHLMPNAATVADPELQAVAAEDQQRFVTKWG